MRIAIVGAGAIGTLMGAKLAESGQEVCFLDRQRQVTQLRSRGIILSSRDEGELRIEHLMVSKDAEELGVQDLVILAVKAHHIANVAPRLAPLLGADTAVMTVQNGLPWWYFSRHGGEYEGRQLRSLDPEGVIQSCIDSSRVIGCVAYPAAEALSPGIVRHVEGNRFTIGELDGRESDRCRNIAAALIEAGFKSYVIDNIRAEIWLKAWGALSFNAISALTRATMVDICQSPPTRWLAGEMMREAEVVANRLGIEFRHSIEKRIDGAEKVGAHKTSMLQDVEQGNSLEVEALLGSVLELADLTDTPMPATRSIFACTNLFDQTLSGARSAAS